MLLAGVSTLVSQLIAPSAIVLQLVGTTLLSLLVLLPGPSIQPYDCALAAGAIAALKLSSSVKAAVSMAVVIVSSLRITTLPPKCFNWGSPDGFPGAADPIGQRDRSALPLHWSDRRRRATRLQRGKAETAVRRGR